MTRIEANASGILTSSTSSAQIPVGSHLPSHLQMNLGSPAPIETHWKRQPGRPLSFLLFSSYTVGGFRLGYGLGAGSWSWVASPHLKMTWAASPNQHQITKPPPNAPLAQMQREIKRNKSNSTRGSPYGFQWFFAIPHDSGARIQLTSRLYVLLSHHNCLAEL